MDAGTAAAPPASLVGMAELTVPGVPEPVPERGSWGLMVMGGIGFLWRGGRGSPGNRQRKRRQSGALQNEAEFYMECGACLPRCSLGVGGTPRWVSQRRQQLAPLPTLDV